MKKTGIYSLFLMFGSFGFAGMSQASSADICGDPCHYYAHHCYCGDDGSTPQTVVSCSHESPSDTIFVEIQTGSESGVFRATISEKPKFAHIPAGTVNQIAVYDPVFHNQHMDFYNSGDGKFSLQVGDATPHVHYGDVEMDLDSCSETQLAP